MMLVAEVVLLSPILDWLLIIAVGLLALMFLVAPRDITRQQQLPQVDEEPNPLEVAYLRRQSSGVIELVIYDLVEAGQLEVVEDDQDEEYWGMQQVAGSTPPPVTDESDDEGEFESDDEGEFESDGEGEFESDDEGEFESDDEGPGALTLETVEMAARRMAYDYFDGPKFPRQALALNAGLRSFVGRLVLPVHQRLMQRRLMSAVASGKGCAAGCLLLSSIITAVAFLIGSFVMFATRAFQGGDVWPLLILVAVLLMLRVGMSVFKPRVTRILRFLRPRTSWGERYLEELEDRFFDMLPPPSDANGNGNGQQGLALDRLPQDQRQTLQRLAVAVFGSWVLAGGPFQDVAYYLGTADPEPTEADGADQADGADGA
jgi:hypothetical protein